MPNWVISFIVFVVAQLLGKAIVGAYLETKTRRKSPVVVGGANLVSSVVALIGWAVGYGLIAPHQGWGATLIGLAAAIVSVGIFGVVYASQLV